MGMFFLYNLLAALVLVPYYLYRALRHGRYGGTLRQRLGFLDPSLSQTGRATVWLHAVSVGEVLSCQELVAGLRRAFPHARILVSTTTATGHTMAREKLSNLADGFFYAPLDFPFAARRTLHALRPRLVIIAETEIWPNLFRHAKRLGAGLLVVNARLSDRSAPRYRAFRFFFRRVLALPDAILAQSDLDRSRLLNAGAPPERVVVGGNLKFDFRPSQAPPSPEILALLENRRPVILAGSTRETEEQPVLQAFLQVSEQYKDAILILAPRHPDRFDAVAELLSQSGIPFVRRSRLPSSSAPILLLDSLGELASLYALADVVFIGGSLVNWGGHNVLEPAFVSRPVIVGPRMQNFRAIADALLAAGGLIQIEGPGELGPAMLRLLDHPVEAAAIGERARRLAESHRGATDRALDRATAIYHAAVPDPPPGPLARLALWLPARIWEAVARRRRPRPRRLSTFTISIGNLTAGGAGKTPVILWLVEQLQSRGLSCAVLTRGYRRASQDLAVLAPGDFASAAETGDEAQLLLRRSRLPLGISADRYRAGTEIERRFHPDVFLLDDGFQHRQLSRDLDLVLIDATAPFGGRELLPLGRLREPLSALARAHAILITRAEPSDRWDGLQQEIRRHNSRAPIFLARFEPAAWVDASTGEEKPLDFLRDRPALAFCGIGNPRSFFGALETLGLTLVARVAFPDHHRYSPSDLARLRAQTLVTTEKDLVNLPSLPPSLYWLKTRVVLDKPADLLSLMPSASIGLHRRFQP
ncbi:MAG: tetraacyldisaccharide 4'-kinase [Acidobacteria bacterium]|nr:tetraacyldisaccharide 4'-kinase [Acidobacteriota bacterium]